MVAKRKKVNDCKYCSSYRYDRHNRVWVCASGSERIEGKNCKEFISK